MSLHGNLFSTPDGKWGAYVEVEHFLGDTTTRIYTNDAAKGKHRRNSKDPG